MQLDISHLIVFIVGAIVGGGITYAITVKLNFNYKGGVSQRDIRAGGDVIGGNKENRNGRE